MQGPETAPERGPDGLVAVTQMRVPGAEGEGVWDALTPALSSALPLTAGTSEGGSSFPKADVTGPHRGANGIGSWLRRNVALSLRPFCMQRTSERRGPRGGHGGRGLSAVPMRKSEVLCFSRKVCRWYHSLGTHSSTRSRSSRFALASLSDSTSFLRR